MSETRPVPRRASPWGTPEGEHRQPKAHRCNDRVEDVIQVCISTHPSSFSPSLSLTYEMEFALVRVWNFGFWVCISSVIVDYRIVRFWLRFVQLLFKMAIRFLCFIYVIQSNIQKKYNLAEVNDLLSSSLLLFRVRISLYLIPQNIKFYVFSANFLWWWYGMIFRNPSLQLLKHFFD